ncbi:MAG: ATP-binding cassette domain-containing protein [Candidatus Firestonebacteria bacterium]|nr:ATP-binding cassette domain-containing protein [Candidatus Firestonebacteria bacterium]
MIRTSEVSLAFGGQKLFKEVSISFTPGNCYGLIGANGSGKSTFLKILAGDIQPDAGSVIVNPDLRVALLRQDQFAFDEYTPLQTVIMGHTRLYKIMQERDALYAKPELSEAEGIRAGELEGEFAELNGYDADSEAATLLDRLGVGEELLNLPMKALEAGKKIRVLLAQAIFGNPDVLLLDEPTNHLDLKTITWLENFLYNFQNTVVVVSHDRHFLNKVCTHIADVDFGKIQLYVGNYDFWYQASQLAMQQKKDSDKRATDKIAELQAFVQRFSANASKSKQASARKKLIEKLTPEEMPASSRRTPFIAFKPDRRCGDKILEVNDVSKSIDGVPVLENLSFRVNAEDKIALIGTNNVAKTVLFQILAGELQPDHGFIKWGQTITWTYGPKDNAEYFLKDQAVIDWLRQYTTSEDTNFIRGFLGRMLFSGDEAMKSIGVLSGGERARCMLSRMMISGANVLLLDEPTNHLDLESISSLNDGVARFSDVVIFSSHDHQFVNTVANRIIEFTPGGIIDKVSTFDEYLEDPAVQALRDNLYRQHAEVEL